MDAKQHFSGIIDCACSQLKHAANGGATVQEDSLLSAQPASATWQASVKHLFNLSQFLTKRDAWSGEAPPRPPLQKTAS